MCSHCLFSSRLKVPECFVECHHGRDGDQRQRAEGTTEWPTESRGDSGRGPSCLRWTRCHRENCHQVCCCQLVPPMTPHTHALTHTKTATACYLLIIMKMIWVWMQGEGDSRVQLIIPQWSHLHFAETFSNITHKPVFIIGIILYLLLCIFFIIEWSWVWGLLPNPCFVANVLSLIFSHLIQSHTQMQLLCISADLQERGRDSFHLDKSAKNINLTQNPK